MSKSKQTYRKYDATFKQDILRQLDSGQSAPAIAKSMGISEQLIYSWRASEKRKTVSMSDTSVMARELEQLRSKLKEVEMERDILKKAVSIVSRVT